MQLLPLSSVISMREISQRQDENKFWVKIVSFVNCETVWEFKQTHENVKLFFCESGPFICLRISEGINGSFFMWTKNICIFVSVENTKVVNITFDLIKLKSSRDGCYFQFSDEDRNLGMII